jgi:hypothetical protein
VIFPAIASILDPIATPADVPRIAHVFTRVASILAAIASVLSAIAALVRRHPGPGCDRRSEQQRENQPKGAGP